MGSQQETHKEVRRPNASAFATRWLSLFGSQSGHSKWSHICWPGDVWKAAVILKANTIETIHHAGGRIHLWILAVSRVSRIRGAASSIYPQWWTGLLFRVVACWSRRFYLWPKCSVSGLCIVFCCFWLAAFGVCAGMCKGVAYPLFLPAALRDLIGAVHTWNGQLLDPLPLVVLNQRFASLMNYVTNCVCKLFCRNC